MAKKDNTVKWVGIGIFALLAIFVLNYMGVFAWSAEGGFTPTTECNFDYSGKNVEFEVNTAHYYTGADVNYVCYLYNSQPVSWLNYRASLVANYMDTQTAASGVLTFKQQPGDYFVRCQLSGYYDEFFKIEIPECGDVALSDYNQAPNSVNIRAQPDYTMTMDNGNSGTLANSSSETIYTIITSESIGSDESYFLDEIVFTEDATYAFATDADLDGAYDEGIKKIETIISGGGQSFTVVPFDTTLSIDEFGADSEVKYKVKDTTVGDVMKLRENQVLSITDIVTCVLSLDVVGDADEKCGEGEDPYQITLVDANGATDASNRLF